MGLRWQRMESESLRTAYKMKKGQKGILVRHIQPTYEAAKHLKPDDIIMRFDDTPVASDGTVPFRCMTITQLFIHLYITVVWMQQYWSFAPRYAQIGKTVNSKKPNTNWKSLITARRVFMSTTLQYEPRAKSSSTKQQCGHYHYCNNCYHDGCTSAMGTLRRQAAEGMQDSSC